MTAGGNRCSPKVVDERRSGTFHSGLSGAGLYSAGIFYSALPFLASAVATLPDALVRLLQFTDSRNKGGHWKGGELRAA